MLREEEMIVEESFKITDTGKANWALRKIAEEKKEIEELKKIADKEIERINKWLENESKNHENSIQYFEGLLMSYLIAEDKKKMSLPYGKFNFKKQHPLYERNEELVLKQVDEKYVKVKKSLDWANLKKALEFKKDETNRTIAVDTETGEVIQGIVVTDRPDKFEVKIEEVE